MASKTFDDCGGPYDLLAEHSITSWENKPTTCAEQAVIRYLLTDPSRFQGKRLLHVGIGNGALFRSLRTELGSFTGLTISRPEQENFIRNFGDADREHTLLINKHDERFFGLIGNSFDIVVDVNLKSFACCEKHFQSMIRYFAESLSPGGIIMTAQSGLDFGWAGNTAVAFTPGADVAPSVSKERILGTAGLMQLSADLGLEPHSITMDASDSCDAETLWILEKASACHAM